MLKKYFLLTSKLYFYAFAYEHNKNIGVSYMKIASTQVIPKFKTAVLAGALSIAALTATSCSKTSKNNKIMQDTLELTNLKNKELDLSKPNLPVITDDYIYYK